MSFAAGDLVTVDFPDATGIKRRPAVILSSAIYHAIRPELNARTYKDAKTGLNSKPSETIRTSHFGSTHIFAGPA